MQFDETTELMTYGSMLSEADDRHYTIEFENAVEALNDGQTSLYPMTPEVFHGNPLGEDYRKNLGLERDREGNGWRGLAHLIKISPGPSNPLVGIAQRIIFWRMSRVQPRRKWNGPKSR